MESQGLFRLKIILTTANLTGDPFERIVFQTKINASTGGKLIAWLFRKDSICKTSSINVYSFIRSSVCIQILKTSVGGKLTRIGCFTFQCIKIYKSIEPRFDISMLPYKLIWKCEIKKNTWCDVSLNTLGL